MSVPTDATKDSWQRALAAALAASGVECASWVPDKRLAPIWTALRGFDIQCRTLTREEECVGYVAGYRAGGGMPLALLQCSGLGNALNAIASLAVPYGLGFPMVISMRGTLGERNPSQVPMGRAAVDMLSLLGVQSFVLRYPADARAIVQGAVELAREGRQVVAITLDASLPA